jgi:hypothetical protein
MPAIRCRCNNVISYGEIPNPNEMRMISDVAYDNYTGLIDAEDLYEKMTSILQCNVCGRLWIYWNGYRSTPTSYMPEDKHT